jgi:hypothetical protein
MAHKTMPQKNLKRKEAPKSPAKASADKKAKPAKPEKPAKDAKAVAAKEPKDAKKGAKPPAGKPVAKGAGPAKPGKDDAAKAAATKDGAPPKKKRSKSGGVRLKAYWGVFNQMMKRVAVFEYAERRQADKKVAELSASSKGSHFVQLVKEVIRDAD